MPSDIQKNIAKYMNGMSNNREYTVYDVSKLASAIKIEYERRKAAGIVINGKCNAGKALINQRVAEVANEDHHGTQFNADDVQLYKKCWAEEFMDRTGKCAWGYASVRTRLGYDPKTGYEIK